MCVLCVLGRHHILPPHAISGSKGVARVTVPICDETTVWLPAKGRGYDARIPEGITTSWLWARRLITILVKGDVISCETPHVATFRLWRPSNLECVHSSRLSPNGAVVSLLKALSVEGCIANGTTINAWEVFALHKGSSLRADIEAGCPTPWLDNGPSHEGKLRGHAAMLELQLHSFLFVFCLCCLLLVCVFIWSRSCVHAFLSQ